MAIGQNLIIDSSFEFYDNCPNNDANSRLSELKYWYSPTMGTPDYYNKCAGKVAFGGVPENGFGTQKPKNGSGFIGLILAESPEYAQCQLKSPLVKGQKYCITLYANCPDVYNISIDRISVALTNYKMTSDGFFVFLDPSETNVVNLFSKDSFIIDKLNWVKLCGNYEALGGEEFLTIGRFRNSGQRSYRPPPMYGNGVESIYYYIDDISILKLDNRLCDYRIIKNTDKLIPVIGKTTILKNIFFETDKSKLLTQSFQELDTLINFLKINLKTKIQIDGHTDNSGNENHNLLLSNERAKSVANYLILKGIDYSRISYKGYGSSKPVESNKTESGRLRNRRVEFKIIGL